MTTTPKDFHTGGINSPHEWSLFLLNNTAQFFFWDTFLDGMAENNEYATAKHFAYEPPHSDQYANGCFALGAGH